MRDYDNDSHPRLARLNRWCYEWEPVLMWVKGLVFFLMTAFVVWRGLR